MLEPVFKPNVNFESMVERLATLKVAFEPQALQAGFVQELLDEVMAGEFAPVKTHGKVEESYDRCKLTSAASFTPKLTQLADVLTWGIRLGCGKRMQYLDWYPNDIEIHRYQPGSVAITSHRDFQCNRDFVAITTLAGHAEFRVHGLARDGRAKIYHTGPGSLALVDISQFHAIDPPKRGERIVVVMWMNQTVS